ncbi:MAG: T9SS type A sorting domain-containing protein [Crocinitomicaceae bacterium]|nr:T9SS type A sorting domain-containing protein [Crocinitomicaceae bacterium]
MKKILTLFATFGLLMGTTSYAQITVFPYNEDFETETQGPTSGCPLSYTMMAAGWTNETGDGTDWTADVGGTTSGSTGPSVDQMPGTTTGHYLYTETSGCNSTTAVLTSPSFDLPSSASAAAMDFWYHMYGASMGTLVVEYTIDGGITWTNIGTLTDNIDLWQQFTFDLTPFLGNIVQFRFTGNLGTSFTSDMAIDNFNVVAQVTDDIGGYSIQNPVNPLSTGVQTVTGTIFNYGTNDVTSATIGWSINGTPQTPTVLPATVTAGTESGTIILGAYDFPIGTTDICIWTELPNGNADNVAANDTFCVSLCTGLNGTYTIGGGTPDYATFADATSALMSCGISGPVVFDVAAGVYNESVTLGPILGSSATNTVTFNGGSAATTVVEHDATGKNGTINLEGADNVIFENLTIRNTGTTDAWGVFLTDTAEYDTIQNCIIEMAYSSGIIDVAGICASGNPLDDFTEGNNANFCAFDNNVITGGERGIVMEGETIFGNWMNGISITNNQIYNVDDYGIYMDNQQFLNISGNWIDSIQQTFSDGIYLFDIVDFNITNNIVNVQDYGVYIADGNFGLDGAPTGVSNFINNMVTSTTDRAVYFDDVEVTNVWHNSVYNDGTAAGAMYVNDLINVDIRNNIFVSNADYAFESLDDLTTGSNVLDYNNYYTNGAVFISEGLVAQPDLASWQTAQPTLNVNSISVNPVFNSSTDLHVVSIALNDQGDNSVGVPLDIDGDTRPAGTNVDMGADEFTPLTDNVELVAIVSPAGSQCGTNNTEVTVVIRNLADTIFSCPITAVITGDITQTLNTTYNDTLLFNEQDTVVVGTFNGYNGGFINITAYTEYPGDQDTSNDTIYDKASTLIPFEPAGTSDPSCGYDTTTLYADTTYISNFFDWWDSASGGSIVGTGNSFVVPSIATQDTYYLAYQAGGLDSMMTTLTGTNGCSGGNMFDVTSVSGISISGFRVNSGLAAGTNVPVTIHYIAGGYAGNETNAAAWTTEGSYTVQSGGAGNASTFLSLTSPITVGAGQTVGIYVEYDADYTTGANTYTNGDVTIDAGVGLCSSFGGINDPRTFNGIVYWGGDPCSAIRVPVSAFITANADVNLGPDSVACAANGAVVLDPGPNLTNHMWQPSGNTGATESVTSNGQYIVTAEDINTGCEWSDTILIIFGECASIDEQSGLEEMNVFPNPNNGQFTLQIQLMNGVELKNVELVSTDGRLLRTLSFNGELGSYQADFDVRGEARGIYFIRVTTNEGIAVQRVIVE